MDQNHTPARAEWLESDLDSLEYERNADEGTETLSSGTDCLVIAEEGEPDSEGRTIYTWTTYVAECGPDGWGEEATCTDGGTYEEARSAIREWLTVLEQAQD